MSDLPVPAGDQHPYLHLQPAETPIDPVQARSACKRLHAIADTIHSVTERLNPLTNTRAPTVECLFVRPEAITDLEDTLRQAVPDTDQLTTRRGDPLADLQQREQTHAAGIQYEATASRRNDWQTALVPFAPAGHRDHTHTRFEHTRTSPPDTDPPRPLETVLQVLATADCPAAYQLLCYPYEDWSLQADQRIATSDRQPVFHGANMNEHHCLQ